MRQKAESLNGKVVLVAAPEGFRDEELFVPEDVFSEAGAFVLTASGTKRTLARGTPRRDAGRCGTTWRSAPASYPVTAPRG